MKKAPTLPPECLKEIFKCLQNDPGTLHSCLLINRRWCQSSVGFLWQDPLKYLMTFIKKAPDSEELFHYKTMLETLISGLSPESKNILKNIGIDESLLNTKQTLFDYFSYCKVLKSGVLKKMINEGLHEYHIDKEEYQKDRELFMVEQELYKHFISKANFIVSLTLDPKIKLHIPYFSGADKCFSELKELNCASVTTSAIFYGIAQISKHIEKLMINPCCKDNFGLIHLIRTQENLQCCRLLTNYSNDDEYDFDSESTEDLYTDEECYELGQALITQSNSLTFLEISGTFCIPILDVLSFKNLTTLRYGVNYKSYTNNEIEKLVSTGFPKLENLIIYDGVIPLKIVISWIELSEGNLKNLYLGTQYRDKIVGYVENIIKLLTRSCPNLLFITTWINTACYEHLDQLFKNCKKLKGISLIPVKGEGAEGDEYLKTLGEILPSSIKILRLRTDKNEWKFTNEALKTFFESRKSNGPISLQMVSNSSSSSVRGYIDIIKKYHEEGALSEIRRLFYNKDHEPNWKPDAGFHLEESLDAVFNSDNKNLHIKTSLRSSFEFINFMLLDDSDVGDKNSDVDGGDVEIGEVFIVIDFVDNVGDGEDGGGGNGAKEQCFTTSCIKGFIRAFSASS
ncbi:9619_t:CDS:2 [Entrophospora sp. SA101]|nr:5704_t:CDS:2 [Entrophospora sp. SA101]CAJ0871356.1 9619_t:CDS:2 [Entrophospora sp. SA101]